MLEKYLRRYYQCFFVNPVAARMKKWSFLSPSHLTIIGCILGIASAVAIGFDKPWSGLSLLFLSGYIDTLDGTLARFNGQTSHFGCALDIISDRIVELAVVIGLYEVHLDKAFLSLLMLGAMLICVTSFLIVGIFSEKTSSKSFYYSPGLIERGEAFVFFGLMICLPSFFSFLAILFSFLVLLTAALRLYQFYQLQYTSQI